MAIVKTSAGKRIKVSPGTKGSISEHIATAWLLSNGYDVFRNVSPTGRADLMAVDWDKDETIRVDVKSAGFTLGNSEKVRADRQTIDMNQGFGIRYLVVGEDGKCAWHDDKPQAANDNDAPIHTWWRDRKTMQRFLVPGNYMTNKQWTYFCHWLVRAYPDYIVPFKEEFVRSISSRGIGCDSPRISEKELKVLGKLLQHIYDKLVSAGAVDFLDEKGIAA